jgi:hypothetical protein
MRGKYIDALPIRQTFRSFFSVATAYFAKKFALKPKKAALRNLIYSNPLYLQHTTIRTLLITTNTNNKGTNYHG